MARKTNWEIFCCLCGKELPYKRIMEQSPNGGNLRYIEEEVGFTCLECLEKQPDAKAPVPHTPPPLEYAGRPRRQGPVRTDPGPLRSTW
jgi:hypothetical protein